MVTIRSMESDDLDDVTQLEEECFSRPWRRADFEEALVNENREYLVAECDGRIIGGCMLTAISGEGDVTNVAVREEYRGRHIASMLMERLISLGREKYAVKAFTLEVRSKNEPALRLYSNIGFKSAGIRPGFYDRPKDDAVIMWLETDDEA